MSIAKKIFNTPQVLRASIDFRRAAAKDNKLTVGYAQGVFDILHIGHMTYLNQAREKCDFLIAGVVPDARVRAKKGADRPILTQKFRAYGLASLSAVDAVSTFDYFNQEQGVDEQKHALLFGAMNANVLFLGAGYAPPDVPDYAKDFPEGRIIYIQHDVNFHTTDIIRRLEQIENAPAPR